MTNYTFKNPSTGEQVTIDAPTHDDAVRQLNSRVTNPRAIGQPGHPLQKTDPAPQDFGSTGANFAAGVGQGLLDLPEGIGQLAEHIPYVGGAVRAVIPNSLRDWARNYRQRAESTTAGEVGEFAGNVIPAFLQPELGIARAGEAVPYIGKGLGFLGRVFERGTLPATLQPVDTSTAQKPRTISQVVKEQTGAEKPQQGDDFWDRKKLQAEVGTALGTAGETVASLLTRIGRSGAAQRAAQQKAESDYNAQVTAHHTGTLARAAEQQAAKGAKAAKDAIPNQTTLRWYKETLDRIGMGDQAPTEVSPASSARVQKLVGEHRNEILNRMELNQTPEFTEQITGIRDAAMDALPESARDRFYKVPPEPKETPLLYDQYGKPISRFTRSGEPPKPAGDWVRTVMEPLEKGDLKGRDLSDYISKLGARAAELAQTAAKRPQDERAEMYAMADAYRQVADAVVGHAAGVGPEAAKDKLALEAANKAYTMWSIGNDAGTAAQGGVMTPRRLLQHSAKRMGEARLKQAFNDPKHPDNALLQHLDNQRKRMEAPLPQVRPASAVPAHPREPVMAAPPGSGVPQAAANALLHYGLWHLGPGAYFAGRHTIPAIARRVAPVLSRAAGATGRGMRRLESPVSRGAGEIVEQKKEVAPSMQFKWPD